MRAAQIQFTTWDKVYNFDPGDLTLKEGMKVIVKTEMGTEMGEVVGFTEVPDPPAPEAEEKSDKSEENPEEEPRRELKSVVRMATTHDLEKLPNLAEKKKALDFVHAQKARLELPMKFIDVHFSFDGSRITFAFIADGRVDFRELVKDLTRHFGRTIRLQQIGIRDEAKIMGDYGHCGKQLCCREHLKDLVSITSEMAEVQQCSHRGSERISGVCGRLMCCLAYEQEGYEDLHEKLPPVGARVNVDGKRGVVVGHHTLKQSVDVEFGGGKNDEGVVAEVDLNRNKKKKLI